MRKLITLFNALLIIFLGGTLAFVMQVSARKLPIRQYFPSENTVAVWDWDNPTTRSSSELERLNQFLYLHQINTVYVDISSYAEFDKNNDQAKKQDLENALVKYVNIVKKHDIKILAATGNTDWSKPDQRHIPLAIQNFVFSFNNRHPEDKLTGLEFDIESYNQAGFAESSMTEKSLVLTEFLNTVQELTLNYQKNNQADLELGFAIPYWFDNENGNIPTITWQSKTGPTLFHLMDTLNTIPKSNVVVMAYRNAASGNDGSIFHSRTEVEYAQSKAQNVKVIIGQEVNDVEPSKITFYGMDISEMTSEIKIINDVFKNNSSYDGIAINDLAGLQKYAAN